jgi:hypothetical protein
VSYLGIFVSDVLDLKGCHFFEWKEIGLIQGGITMMIMVIVVMIVSLIMMMLAFL